MPPSVPRPAHSDHAPAPAPLLVTRDSALREHLQRLAAAAGASPQVCGEPGVALRAWSAAPVVLVGVDLADELAGLAPSRRGGVHLVAWEPAPDAAYRAALALGALDLLEVPRCDAWLADLLGDVGESVASRGLVVGVTAGAGGAGATTFAAALGQVASLSGPTLVVDVDQLGPGLDRVLGLEEHDGVRWDDLARTAGRLAGTALRDAVPHRQRLGVLSWRPGATSAPAADVLREVVAAARRGHDTVLLDLPRGPSRVTEEALARLDRLVVVVRPGLTGLASAARRCAWAAEFLPAGSAPLLVVRGTPLDGSRVEQALGRPVLLSMGEQRGVAEAVDLGLGPVRTRRGALARAAAETLDLLAVRGRVGPPGSAAAA